MVSIYKWEKIRKRPRKSISSIANNKRKKFGGSTRPPLSVRDIDSFCCETKTKKMNLLPQTTCKGGWGPLTSKGSQFFDRLSPVSAFRDDTTGVYGDERTVVFFVHFWRFFGLAQGLFWRPRARKIGGKATFCAHESPNGPSVEIAD